MYNDLLLILAILVLYLIFDNLRFIREEFKEAEEENER